MKKKMMAVLFLAGLAAAVLSACGDRNEKDEIVLENTQGPSSAGQRTDDAQNNSNLGSAGSSDEAALSELTGILGEISASVEVGTAGASLKAVPVTLTLMDWAAQYEAGDDAVKGCMEQYLAGLDEGEREDFRMQFELVYSDSQELTSETGQSLIEDAGCDAPNYPYDAAKLTELAALKAALK